jgi:diguanylate cyclase (GGDEF)-like protein/PAS domain S-box-containing protein
MLLTAALAGVALLATVSTRGLQSQPMPSWALVVSFFVALTAAGLVNLEYYFRGEVDAIDHFEAALAPAIFFLPPPLVVVVVAVAKATSQALRGVHPIKASFNVAQWSAAAALGCVAFAALRDGGLPSPRDLAPLAAAMVVVALVNVGALVMAITLVQERPLDRGFLRGLAAGLMRDSSVTLAVNLAFGLLFIATYAWAPATWPVLLVPLALLHWASRGYAMGRVGLARVKVVQRATSALNSPLRPDEGFSAFCAEVGLGLERDAVDLMLIRPAGQEVYTWRRHGSRSSADGDPTRELLDALAGVQGPIHIDASTSQDLASEVLRQHGWRDCTCAPVQVADARAGILCLYDARRATVFPDRELEVVAALAREVGLAVENAALVASMVAERENLSQIVTEAEDGIATLGVDGVVQAWNPALERLTGFDSNQVIGSRGLDVLDPVDVDRTLVSLSGWAHAVEEPPTELLVRTAAGEKRWLSCSYAKALGRDGQVDRLIIMARDVSALKQAEALIAGEAAVLQLIAESAPVEQSLNVLASSLTRLVDGARSALLLLDPTDQTQPRLVASSGVDVATLHAIDAFRLDPSTSIVGAAMTLRRTMAVEDVRVDAAWPQMSEALLAIGAKACWAAPILATQTHRVLGGLLLFSPSCDVIGRATDWAGLLERTARIAAIAVTRSEIERQLAHQATHDPLTRLPNRLLFLDRCEQAMRRRRRTGADVAVVFIDLDGFKLVNDHKGHEVGDQLLVTVGERLRAVIRETDTVARFGGDEFAILCEGLSDYHRVVELAHRVQHALASPVLLAGDDDDLLVPASIGVAVLGDEVDVATLLGNADAAMYRAKQLGGNRCEIFRESFRPATPSSLPVRREMHAALERDEFCVEYQPLVSLTTGMVTGAEALVRWRHPERGLLAPRHFLSVAESSGLIVPIGERVLDLACSQARRWQSDVDTPPALRVHINISALQFLQPDLAETIADVLDRTGASPELVGLEVTESAIMEDTDTMVSAMLAVKQLGVRLIIDDFGTGYSSLTHLKRFPVDELKVDKSFVAGLCDRDEDAAIVNAVIALGHSLGLTVVAEGVESAEQHKRLKDLNCDVGQGYYFGRPGAARNVLPLAG